MAASQGNLEVVKWLVTQRVDVKAKANDDETVLHNAARWGKLDVVKWLVEEKGLDVHAKTNYGDTPFNLAEEETQKEVAEYLKRKMVESAGQVSTELATI